MCQARYSLCGVTCKVRAMHLPTEKKSKDQAGYPFASNSPASAEWRCNMCQAG
jgi:hypothetical protein